MIYDELPLPWRFVDSTSKLFKNDGCTNCEEELFVMNTDKSMLPSFVWVGASFFTPVSFLMRDLESSNVVDLTANVLSDIKSFTIGSNVYVGMTTKIFDPATSPLQVGLYQVEISDGINHIYSEPIRICDDLDHCLVLSWSNTCDLAGIPYTYLNSVVAGDFTNYLFLDKEGLLPSEYETETEQSINLLRQVTVLYQHQDRIMRFKTVGSNWISRVFKSIELHETRSIQLSYDSSSSSAIYSATLEEFEVSLNEISNSECSQEIEVRFRQDDSIITGICCVSNVPEACLTPCRTVLGFFPEVGCVEGAYYMEAVDSGIIVQCVGGNPVTKNTDCVYVFNSTDGNYYYYNGDIWQVTPTVQFQAYLDNGDGTCTIDLSGFTIPGTWVYIMYSCDNTTFTTYPTPFTAAQLGGGISITVQNCADTFYLKCSSKNHTCTYDDSDTIDFTPA